VQQQGSSGTEVHVLDGGSDYGRFVLHAATALGRTDPDRWELQAVDVDRDGIDDLLGVLREGASGRTEVHVLDGASGLSRFSLHTSTPLHAAPATAWSFDVADVDGDGVLDVLALAHGGASGGTEVHVLDGASDYQRWQSHTATPLGPMDPERWTLAAGDHDRDGWPDLYATDRRGASGAEVHVLDGAAGFARWSAHRSTPFEALGAQWELVVGDLDADGYASVLAVDRRGASGRTEVHALNDFTYAGFALHAASALHPTDDAPFWRFSAG
jgi:hypothetical protein